MDFSLQLEDSNKTLTKDVEILSKEKSDLSEKLGTQNEGTVPNFVYLHISCCIMITLINESLFLDRV